MVAKFTRGASAAWDAIRANGWDSVESPIAKLKRKSADGTLPGFGGRSLTPPGATPIRFKAKGAGKPLPELGPSLGRIGSLEVCLATRKSEIRRAQRLRYQVFYEEMSAIPSGMAMLSRRDVDAYDAVCDHLLVIDHAATDAKPFRKARPKVVGTYRLLRGEAAERHFGFYSASEFDIAPLLAAHPGKRLLELGRSCVLKPYRTKRTVELLWAGIYAYVLHHRIDALIGCASLDGTDPSRLALPLSFLHHHARAPDGWRARALPERYVPMDRLDREAIDPKAALQALPPLIKGYLRVGATFGDGAVIDRQFGTTDVFVVLPVTAIGTRYLGHFAPTANARAA
ncbi:GNAT family N-acetyltransferase [Methylobacterium sp. E-025]|uniref:GNAT family N-acetyltransferase n=1 Tax=Methylobacterium sp. E-025 TaxID=2836561 RepID=UPI001FBAFA9E|nr:GNAT family N-acyltransferase [Methylobacterium sp. E-025]MCJ2112666.1 GNAT family N-acetyltransferase [Methylobacterium sp. E-025]